MSVAGVEEENTAKRKHMTKKLKKKTKHRTHWLHYRKNPKISDTRKFGVITLKIEQDGFSLH